MEKEVYSVSELIELGYSRYDLYKAAHSELAYKFIVRTGGKFLFDLKEFKKWRRAALNEAM